MRVLHEKACRTAAVLLAAAVIGSAAQWARADVISDAINAASARLVAEQVLPPNASTSAWEGPAYTGFNGNIIAGLTSAYLVNGVAANKTAAETGGTALIANVNFLGGSYFANEVYGLTQISALQANPASNPYHDAAYNFFANTVGSDVNGFVSRLDAANSQANLAIGFSGLDKTLTTINLAQYTVAAYAVNAPNKGAFRANLINMLGQVADLDSSGMNYQSYPVQALGAAVWALAKTGNGLDSTVITGPTGLTDPLQNAFGGMTLSQLPAALQARIDPVTHTFFAFLNYDDLYGYTEDTAFGILGLDAADFAGHTSMYASDVAAARLALCGAINLSTGVTADNVDPSAATMSGGQFAGMALQALAAPVPEPASIALLMAGTAGLVLRRRRG